MCVFFTIIFGIGVYFHVVVGYCLGVYFQDVFVMSRCGGVSAYTVTVRLKPGWPGLRLKPEWPGIRLQPGWPNHCPTPTRVARPLNSDYKISNL